MFKWQNSVNENISFLFALAILYNEKSINAKYIIHTGCIKERPDKWNNFFLTNV